ncbi:hypothetical protein MUN82_11225 [Hymenobacter aerilatus]|uniref:DUF3823 domain-containing protein n=1 Tax=Hymenobacter aerilatus TaxID=2932251 RepID=A0A8T9SN51_9BACT|nr:hypothetical protein [Hymenobacter aerilatus]UOR03518.1 hypothetical protein MUN82_11225 [Hymenobacter aerilatus]
MLTTRTLALGASFLLIGAGVSSCLTPPDYPDTPSIEFKSITATRAEQNGTPYDAVRVTISFRDGDGDLGLNNGETSPPYSETNSDGTKNKFYNNYFFQPQILRGDTYVDYNLAFPYDSRFPRITSDDRKEPKRGTLNFDLQVFDSTFPTGSKIRFKVSIADRALNMSNEVVTDPITAK